jgi:predicted nuclease of predicted toxin-antitoxin system
VKLLLDENLSPALVTILSDIYQDTSHVRDFGLKSAPDPVVWAHAARDGYTIVSKDADFHHRSFLYGHPPKVIWIRLGNCSTRDVAELLVERRETIEAFHLSAESSFLVLD